MLINWRLINSIFATSWNTISSHFCYERCRSSVWQWLIGIYSLVVLLFSWFIKSSLSILNPIFTSTSIVSCWQCTSVSIWITATVSANCVSVHPPPTLWWYTACFRLYYEQIQFHPSHLQTVQFKKVSVTCHITIDRINI